jgi:predicted permease
MISLLLMKKIAELFLIMFAAFFTVKFNIFKAEDSIVISKLCVYLVSPCMIVNGFLIDMTPEIKQGMLLSFYAAVAISLLFVVVGRIFGRAFHASPVEMSSVQYPNAANLIIPIVTSVLGAKWVLYTSSFIAVQNVCMWTYGIRLFDSGEKASFKKIFLNINMLAVFAGLILLFTGVRLPSVVQGAVSSVGGMAGPCGMLVTGMLIASADLGAMMKNKRLYLVAALRMLICPALVLALMKLTGAAALAPDGDTILLISLLAAMAPTAAMITQISQIYKQDAVYASAINVFTTLCCIVTMPAFVYVYELI